MIDAIADTEVRDSATTASMRMVPPALCVLFDEPRIALLVRIRSAEATAQFIDAESVQHQPIIAALAAKFTDPEIARYDMSISSDPAVVAFTKQALELEERIRLAKLSRL